MPKFRSVEEKYKIVCMMLQLRPNWKDRVLEIKDEDVLQEKVLGRIYRYDPFWAVVDEYKGKPLTERTVCILWNRFAEAYLSGKN